MRSRGRLLSLAALTMILTGQANATPITYTFTDNNEHLLATYSTTFFSESQEFELTNDTGTTWNYFRVRLEADGEYGDYCCPRFTDLGGDGVVYDGPGGAVFFDEDGDGYGYTENMRAFFLSIPSGSTYSFTADIFGGAFPEGMVELRIYGDPVSLFRFDIPIRILNLQIIAATLGEEATFMPDLELEFINETEAPWRVFELKLVGTDHRGLDFPLVRFEDLDEDGVMYDGPGTPSFHDLNRDPRRRPEVLRIHDLEIPVGESLEFSVDIAALPPGGLKTMNLVVTARPEEPRLFLRGDSSGDGSVDISDAVCTLGWLFLGERAGGCMAAMNANGDRAVDISDPIGTLEFLFLGGPAPILPFPQCGPPRLPVDRELGCERAPASCQ